MLQWIIAGPSGKSIWWRLQGTEVSRVHDIMMDFMIWVHLTRLWGPFRAQGSALTRNVARSHASGRGGRHDAPLPPGLATLRVSFERQLVFVLIQRAQQHQCSSFAMWVCLLGFICDCFSYFIGCNIRFTACVCSVDIIYYLYSFSISIDMCNIYKFSFRNFVFEACFGIVLPAYIRTTPQFLAYVSAHGLDCSALGGLLAALHYIHTIRRI